MPNLKPPLPPQTALILLAAGSGVRFGGDKMWVPLGGKPLVSWSLTTFLDCEPAEVILVCQGELTEYQALDPRAFTCVLGGKTRRESVLAGLSALPPSIERVLIHDAARPGVSRTMIAELAVALDAHPAAFPALPVTDTIKQVKFSGAGKNQQTEITSLNRSTLHAAQTPQAFRRDILTQALDGGRAHDTDEIQTLEALKLKAHMTRGSQTNMKVTTPMDLPLVERLLLPPMETIAGSGFDVHRFCTDEEADGRTLVLGGYQLPGERPLAGHSDADVLLHALCDGLYGAMGRGDIGVHFPPTDQQWFAADSQLFLDHALTLLAEMGGHLIHADLTLICETPKLKPHAAAMAAHLHAITGLKPGRLGLKATTTEQLGFTGRKEGIAAQALVTVKLPAC